MQWRWRGAKRMLKKGAIHAPAIKIMGGCALDAVVLPMRRNARNRLSFWSWSWIDRRATPTRLWSGRRHRVAVVYLVI
ncbi:hypothetical protein [Devosia sp.]